MHTYTRRFPLFLSFALLTLAVVVGGTTSPDWLNRHGREEQAHTAMLRLYGAIDPSKLASASSDKVHTHTHTHTHRHTHIDTDTDICVYTHMDAPTHYWALYCVSHTSGMARAPSLSCPTHPTYAGST
jgi:hypothetical protein